MTIYKDQANDTFQKLYEQWAVWKANDYNGYGGRFWHAGNTMHACVEYWNAVRNDESPPTQDVMRIIADTYNYVNSELEKLDQYGIDASWMYDDFGWHANAFSRALQVGIPWGNAPTESEAMGVANRIWNFYTNTYCALNYETSQGEQTHTFPGCYSSQDVQGGNNTVTNALYMNFSNRLYSLDKNEMYLTAANKQYELFQTWIDNQDLLKNGKEPSVPCGLIRWGVADFDWQTIGFPNYGKWVWIGNQGLVIAGLNGFSETNRLMLGTSLTSYAFDHLFDEEKVLHEAPFEVIYGDIINPLPYPWSPSPNNTIQGDPYDYMMGRGVLLRFIGETRLLEGYAEYANQTADAAYKTIDNDNIGWNAGSQENFQKSFISMWGGEAKMGNFNNDWASLPGNPFKVAQLTNILDAQVAAINLGDKQ